MKTLRLSLTGAVLCVAVLMGGRGAAGQSKDKPAPDVLVFNNGDQLTGKLERAVGGSVIFKSDMAGEITVSLDKVKELRSSTDFVALRKEEKKRPIAVTGGVEVAAGAVTMTPPSGQPETIAVKDLAYLIDRSTYDKEMGHDPGFFHGWNGTVTGGATLVRSTDSATTFNAAAGLVRAVPGVPYLPLRNRTSFDIADSYGKQTTPVLPPTSPATSVTVKSSIFHADAEQDRYFSSRMFVLADVSFDHNFAQGLQLQDVFGAGVGYTVLKRSTQELDAKVDAHFERQTYFSATPGSAPTPSVNLFGATIAEKYTRTLPRKVQLLESANFLPAFNNSNDYSANAMATLVLPVWKRLAASVTATDNFLNDPAPFYKKNSFQFATGVTYTAR